MLPDGRIRRPGGTAGSTVSRPSPGSRRGRIRTVTSVRNGLIPGRRQRRGPRRGVR